jgi:hypothetical protein
MEGADVYQIAKNCRTSVKMIEEFYASHIKNMVDASASMCAAPSSRKRERAGLDVGRTATKRWKYDGSWLSKIPSLYNDSCYAGVAKLVDATDLSD